MAKEQNNGYCEQAVISEMLGTAPAISKIYTKFSKKAENLQAQQAYAANSQMPKTQTAGTFCSLFYNSLLLICDRPSVYSYDYLL